MKKRLSIILSIIMAFVIGLSLIACNPTTETPPGGTTPGGTTPGGTTPGGTTPGDTTPGGSEPETSDGMTEKAIAAIDELIKGDGFKGAVSLEYSYTGGKDGFGATIEKRGNNVSATLDGDDAAGYIADLENGYVYKLGGANKNQVVEYNSYFPAGTIEYIKGVLSGYVGEEGSVDLTEIDQMIDYDAATKTITYTYDGKDTVNGALSPLYEAYQKKYTLTKLLDNYVMYFTDGEMSFFDNVLAENSVVELVKTYVNLLSTQTVNDIIEVFNDIDIDIEAILEENGIDIIELLNGIGVEITEEQLKARTLGEMIVGAYNAIKDLLSTGEAAALDEFDDGTEFDIVGGYSEIIVGILKGMFVNEADGKQAVAAVEEIFGFVKDILDSITADQVVDLIEGYVPELAAAVKSSVTLTKFGADFSLKFDDEYRLKEMKLSGELAHSFTEGSDGFYFLSGNDYKFALQVTVSEYLKNPAPFEYTFAAGLPVQPTSVIVVGEATKDVEVYIELAGNNVTLALESGNYAEFKNGKLVIKAEYINEYFDGAEFGDTLVVTIVGAGGISVDVTVIYMTDDIRDAAGFLMGLLQGSEQKDPDIWIDEVVE